MGIPSKKSKTAILLGAGASIDAGLSSSINLTKRVYNGLQEKQLRQNYILFGYVVAKLRARNARRGASAFDDVDIEEVYDALLKLGSRDSDVLSEFVTGWDSIADTLRRPFDKLEFVRGIEDIARSAIASASRSSRHSFSLRTADRAASAIADALNPRSDPDFAYKILQPFFSALISCLKHDATKIDYMKRLVLFARESGSIISTLNYDVVVEQAATDLGIDYDYCLTKWNEQQITQWAKSDLKILKLHGSLN